MDSSSDSSSSFPQDEADFDDDLDLVVAQAQQVLARGMVCVSTAVASLEGSDLHGRDEREEDSDDEDRAVGPGKGNAVLGVKAEYVRREVVSQVRLVRELDDPSAFEAHSQFKDVEFQDFLGEVDSDLSEPMNPQQTFTAVENALRIPRARRAGNEDLLFFFLETLGGSTEGSFGVKRFSEMYGLSGGTMSNYFRHALLSVHAACKRHDPPLIRWPSAAERLSMHGLIQGFPHCVFFVDGNKGRCFRPVDKHAQERKYDGYTKSHCYSSMVVTDIFGRYVMVETVDVGGEADSTIYMNSALGRFPDQHLSPDEYGLADMGYQNCPRLEVPDKKNQNLTFIYRGKRNRQIRRSRMVNEWAMGYINNRYRIFLGRWSFAEELYPIAFEVCAMMANWRFDRRGYALKRREIYTRRLRAQGTDSDSDDSDLYWSEDDSGGEDGGSDDDG